MNRITERAYLAGYIQKEGQDGVYTDKEKRDMQLWSNNIRKSRIAGEKLTGAVSPAGRWAGIPQKVFPSAAQQPVGSPDYLPPMRRTTGAASAQKPTAATPAVNPMAAKWKAHMGTYGNGIDSRRNFIRNNMEALQNQVAANLKKSGISDQQRVNFLRQQQTLKQEQALGARRPGQGLNRSGKNTIKDASYGTPAHNRAYRTGAVANKVRAEVNPYANVGREQQVTTQHLQNRNIADRVHTANKRAWLAQHGYKKPFVPSANLPPDAESEARAGKMKTDLDKMIAQDKAKANPDPILGGFRNFDRPSA